MYNPIHTVSTTPLTAERIVAACKSAVLATTASAEDYAKEGKAIPMEVSSWMANTQSHAEILTYLAQASATGVVNISYDDLRFINEFGAAGRQAPTPH